MRGSRFDPCATCSPGMLTEGPFGRPRVDGQYAGRRPPSLPRPSLGGTFLSAPSSRPPAGARRESASRDGRPLLLLSAPTARATGGRHGPWLDQPTWSRWRRRPPPCDALLVRPDGYIAWSSGRGCAAERSGRLLGERGGGQASPLPHGRR
ncbi:hypothetical protein [Streptomyces sp. KL116D]|uniref:aromatic-ring hydroxylase C-terminal domain-containing protein n=1 Tax=Streptomyces sp. KL116D TaxID=3045152 RepID=UPI0035585167